MLVTLVEAWERKHYPLDLPDPVEAIKYHINQTDFNRVTSFPSSEAEIVYTKYSIASGNLHSR